ncbi:hypothetical protein M885DRAFT_615359 [Pelagophyceae sp. CCMP2097]|nr:hypothetical protein M885DRAFT_615359 [Pelagophyceae sp. CCMP2097]
MATEARGSTGRASVHSLAFTECFDDEPRSARASSVVSLTKIGLRRDSYDVCGVKFSGNAISLLTAFVLFSAITGTQYSFARAVKSVALQADCVSMGVDALTFLGNLVAELAPPTNKDTKRKLELGMSGLSHFLLFAFTMQFLVGAVADSQVEDDDQTQHNRQKLGYTVLAFALLGLMFDMITLFAYAYFGTVETREMAADDDYERLEGWEAGARPQQDALTCGTQTAESAPLGVNTNMCAALLHVISDLARSTTTLVESVVLLNVASVGATQIDGIAATAVCSIIAVGATMALLTWAREVHAYAHGSALTEGAIDRIYGRAPRRTDDDDGVDDSPLV